MKGISQFSQDAISKVLNKYDAFYAFSQKQFEEKKKDGIEYGHVGGGLICRKGQGGNLVDEIDKVAKEAGQKWIETYGKEACIKYELSNYECYYTYDYSDAVAALAPYGITEEEVKQVFYENV